METYLTIEGLGDYLKIAEKTVRKWELNQSIPYRKILGVVRFRLSEIEKWIDEGCFDALTGKTDCVEGELFKDGEAEEKAGAAGRDGAETGTAGTDGGAE